MVNGWLMVGGFKHEWMYLSISYMGCHPKPIDELHHFSRWLLHNQPDMFFDVFFRNHMRKHMIFHMKLFYCWSFGSNVVMFLFLLLASYRLGTSDSPVVGDISIGRSVVNVRGWKKSWSWCQSQWHHDSAFASTGTCFGCCFSNKLSSQIF